MNKAFNLKTIYRILKDLNMILKCAKNGTVYEFVALI